MKKRGFDLKRIVWVTRGRISTLTMEQFSEILDRLPLDFEFELSNISEETNGHWIKERFRENKTGSEKSHFIWHNLTNNRYCSSVSFFPIKNRIIDAIHRKGAFFTYFKIKKDWHTLHQVFMGYRTSNKLIKEKLKKLYYEQSKSLEDIAKKYGCSRMYISKIMKKYGLERRTQSEARIEAIKKGKFERFEYDDINENFFIGWSPGMAWVLGLLFTDGNIDNTRVAINSVDIELLEKIKRLLNSSKPIQKRTQFYDKSKHIYEFTFSREKMREDLNRLGLHQRKSLTMIFPDVPEKYVRHFIRGCWDGDGSIFISGGKINANYACGSFDFINRLGQELYKIGIHKRRLPVDKTDVDRMWSSYPIGKYPLTIHKEKRSKSYYIKIDSKDNLEKLFHYFYDDVDESIYLTRKFNVFLKGLKLLKGAEAEQLSLNFSF